MNIDQIKKEFPIFDEKIQNNDLVYLDSANSSQKPKIVLDRINDFYSKQFSNVGRSLHYLAVTATNLYENTRSSVQKYINAKDKNEIVFTKGATEAINLVANTFGQKHLNEGDEVLITELEHHSNIVPWQILRDERDITLKFIPMAPDGTVDMDAARKLIGPKTKLLSISAMSNALGSILPVAELVSIAKEHGATVLIDGAQAIPHMPFDVQTMGADFVAFSGHKMLGPTGVGVAPLC